MSKMSDTGIDDQQRAYNTPRVKHIKEQVEINDVYIGRPSKWGNPYSIGQDGTRSDVIAKHREWLKGQPHLLDALPELKGKNLVCYCAPQACHGDTLLKLTSWEDPAS